MAEQDLLFRIIAQDDYKREMEEARKSVENMTDAEKQAVRAQHDLAEASKRASGELKETKLSFTELNQAMEFGQKVLSTFKQAFEFAKEGAAIQRIGEQFDATAASFGANGDQLIRKIDEVTGRTIDDEEAMRVASRTMTQGVVQDSDQIVKMFEIARASSVRFGGDTVSAYQAISTAVEYGNARVLRSVVGVVDFKEAYDKLASTLGKTAKELTDQEMLQARLNAVLERGAKLVDDVGDSVDDNVSKLQRMERAAGDLGDNLKTTFAEIAVPVFEQATVTLEALNGTLQSDIASVYADHVEEMTKRLMEGKETQESFRAELERSAVVAGRIAPQSYEEAQRGVKRVDQATLDLIESQINLTKAIESSKGEISEAEQYHRKYAKAVEESSTSVENLASAEDLAKQATSELNAIIGGAVGKELEQYGQKQDENREKVAALQLELDKLESTHGRVAQTQARNAMSAAELNLASLQLADTQARLAQETDPTKQAELAVKVENLTEKISGANATTTTWVDNSKRIGEIRGQLDDLNGAYDANAKAHEEATARIVFGMLEQRAAMDGLTSKEVEALTAVGKELGLYDEATAKTMGAVNIAWDEFVKTGNIEKVTEQAAEAADGVDILDHSVMVLSERAELAGRRLGRVEGVAASVADTAAATEDAKPKVEKLDGSLRGAAGSAGALAKAAGEARANIEAIPSEKEIVITTYYRAVHEEGVGGALGGRQAGGMVYPGQSYRVHPPELFFPQSTGFIMGQDDTRRLLSGVDRMVNLLGSLSAGESNYYVNDAVTGQALVEQMRRGIRQEFEEAM